MQKFVPCGMNFFYLNLKLGRREFNMIREKLEKIKEDALKELKNRSQISG